MKLTEMAMFEIQRAITPKVGKSEIWLQYQVHCLIMFNISVKFHKNIYLKWYQSCGVDTETMIGMAMFNGY